MMICDIAMIRYPDIYPSWNLIQMSKHTRLRPHFLEPKSSSSRADNEAARRKIAPSVYSRVDSSSWVATSIIPGAGQMRFNIMTCSWGDSQGN
jgi:hypothetical protein